MAKSFVVDERFDRKTSGKPGADGAEIVCLLVEDGFEAGGARRNDCRAC